jgi:transposase
MPAYSPDFNPTEYVFGKLKCLLKYQFRELTNTNLKEAVYTAANFIITRGLAIFYQITGYLDP